MPTDNVTNVQVSGPLAGDQAVAVLDLVQRAAQDDGVGPLSEHVMLHVRYGGEPQARNFLVWRSGLITGFGHLDPGDAAAAASGEMLIDPRFRRHGLGRVLIRAMIAEAAHHELRLWAHGDLPAAIRLAASAGFERTRSLWQMRLSLQSPPRRGELADGIAVRTFQVGQDEDDWLQLNAAAFAHHPEQGGWTRADLDLREQEPWFDPAGFFLAERGGRLVGFHWTKVHAPADGHDAIGEVYVVGIDPAERGTGLGRALTVLGLQYLRDQGLAEVMLYVDEDNAPAIKLYESLGFERWATDVMFTHAPS